MKKKQKTKTIKIACGNGIDYHEVNKVKGDLISIRGLKGIEFVVHKTHIYSGFTITEVSTGHSCGSGYKKELAIKDFNRRLKEFGKEKFHGLIKKRLVENKKRGLYFLISPKTQRDSK